MDLETGGFFARVGDISMWDPSLPTAKWFSLIAASPWSSILIEQKLEVGLDLTACSRTRLLGRSFIPTARLSNPELFYFLKLWQLRFRVYHLECFTYFFANLSDSKS